jgi:hypothetical protein
MPVRVELIENGCILHYVFADPWTLNDMQEVNRRAREYYDAADHTIHVLLDVRKVRALPSGFMRARHNPDVTHPNAGHIAVVGASMLVKTIGDLVARLANFERVTFFEDEQDAWDYLHDILENS